MNPVDYNDGQSVYEPAATEGSAFPIQNLLRVTANQI